MSFPTSNSFNNLYEILRKTENKNKVGYLSTRLIKFVSEYVYIDSEFI
jgi:hypothetical protein